MIKINLLGQVEKPKKPKAPKRESHLPVSKKYIYIGLLLVAIVTLVYTYLPEQQEEQVTVVPQPVPQQPEPVPQKPDTIPEPVAEEKPPSEPIKSPVQEKISDDFTIRAASVNKTEVDGYCILRDAVPNNINYTLISVTENNFISELVTTNSRMKELFQNNVLKHNFKVIGANTGGIPPALTTYIWGALPKSNAGNTAIDKFHKPEEIIKEMRSIGRRSGFVLKAYSVKESAPQGSYKLSSIMFKFSGADKNTVSFLKKLTNENKNFVIVKISGVPDKIKNMVQIALNLEVFIPA